MICYQIFDWDKHFENNKSRTHDKCSFVCMPNKQHGLGFRRIWSLPDGAAVFGVWCALLQKASQQGRPRCGWLTENGRSPSDPIAPGVPLTPDVLAVLIGTSKENIQRALDVVSSPNIGWVKALDVSDTAVPSEGHQKDTAVPSEGHHGALKERKKEGTESAQTRAPTGGDPQTPQPQGNGWYHIPFEETEAYKRCMANREALAAATKARAERKAQPA